MPSSDNRAEHERDVSRFVRAAATATVLALAACGGGGAAVPAPGLAFGTPPPLDGQNVMVVPVQNVVGVPSGSRPDAELAFALRERGARVEWIFPDALRRLTERNPGVDVGLDRLPVADFLRARVERVGDPLFGHLRRLGALADASLVLIPVRLRYRPEPVELEDRTLDPAMEWTAALVDVRGGWVHWFGVVDGETGEADDPRALASAAAALARSVAP